MIKFLSIAQNTFVQTLRQPVLLLILLATYTVLVLAVPLTGWTVSTDYHATDQMMLRNLGLSTLLLAGLLAAAFSASSVLSREIEDRTALTVISKPVPRSIFVLGKFAGVAAAVAVVYYLCSLVFLLTVRHKVMPAASDPYDWPVIVLGVLAFVTALLIALAGNFFFAWPFPSAWITSSLVTFTLAMALVLFIGKGWTRVAPGYDRTPVPRPGQVKVHLARGASLDAVKQAAREKGLTIDMVERADQPIFQFSDSLTLEKAVERASDLPGVRKAAPVMDPPVIDGQLVLGMVLMFMAALVLTAVAIAASTRFGLAPTLLIAIGLFLAGSMYTFVIRQYVEHVMVLRPIGWLTPNLSYFYPLDALMNEKPIPLSYVGQAALYCLAYVGAVLAVGIGLFQTRQLEGQRTSASMPGLMALLAGLHRIAAVVVGLVGLEALLGHGYALLNSAFTPGLPLAAGLLILPAAIAWVLWGLFARGVRWTWWLLLTAYGLGLLAYTSAWFVPAVRRQMLLRGAGALHLAVGTIVCAVVVLILILPGTRRHFRSVAA